MSEENVDDLGHSEAKPLTFPRRVKRLQISPEIFMDLLKDGNKFEIVKGIPSHSKFRGFAHDAMSNSISVFVEHQSFEEVADHCAAPDFPLIQGKRIV